MYGGYVELVPETRRRTETAGFRHHFDVHFSSLQSLKEESGCIECSLIKHSQALPLGSELGMQLRAWNTYYYFPLFNQLVTSNKWLSEKRGITINWRFSSSSENIMIRKRGDKIETATGHLRRPLGPPELPIHSSYPCTPPGTSASSRSRSCSRASKSRS